MINAHHSNDIKLTNKPKNLLNINTSYNIKNAKTSKDPDNTNPNS